MSSELLLQKSEAAMEASQSFGFLRIVKESIKLIPKTGKIMVTITLLSLLPSLLFLLLIYFQKFLTKRVYKAIEDSGYTPNQIITFHLALLLLAGIGFLLATAVISQITATVAILASAVSYTDEKPSLHQRLATMRRRCSGQRKSSTRFWWGSQAYRALAVAALTFYLRAFGLDVAAVAAVVAALGFSLYAGVVGNLTAVVTVLEEGEAAERARELVVGHRLQGLMLNLFVCFPILVGFVGSYMLLEDRWYVNIDYVAMNGMLLLGVCFLTKMFIGIAYTVFYFECKKVRDLEIDTLVKV